MQIVLAVPHGQIVGSLLNDTLCSHGSKFNWREYGLTVNLTYIPTEGHVQENVDRDDRYSVVQR